MDLRIFCEEGNYPIVLLSTYAIDFLFFERTVLPALQKGGATTIYVLADTNQIDEAIKNREDQIKEMGSSYVVEPVRVNGAFHPKIIMRAGKDGVQIAVGSGNLTNGGWRSNEEIFTSWHLDTSSPHNSGMMNYILTSLETYLPKGSLKRIRRRVEDLDWYSKSDHEQVPGFFITQLDHPLCDDLREYLGRRQYDRLTVFTGSTDSGADFIIWCRDNLGVVNCTLVANPENIDFHRDTYDDLDSILSIAPITTHDFYHAKMYYFEGELDKILLVGSANCSGSAWTHSRGKRKNVEAVVIFDPADESIVRPILARIPENTIKGVDLEKPLKLKDYSYPSTPKVCVQRISWESEDNRIQVQFEDELPEQAEVSMFQLDEFVQLFPDPNNQNVWVCNNYRLKTTAGSKFVTLNVSIGGELIELQHWVNDSNSLLDQEHIAGSYAAIESFTKSTKTSDITNALNSINQAFNNIMGIGRENKEHLGKNARSEEKDTKSKTPSVQAPPFTIDDLFVKIGNEDHSSIIIQMNEHSSSSLSFNSIMKAFFGDKTEIAENIDDESAVIIEPEEEDIANDSVEIAQTIENDDLDKSMEKLTDKQKHKFNTKFRSHIDGFLNKLIDPENLENMSTRLYFQALSYILLIFIRGIEREFIEDTEARDWFLKSINHLFTYRVGENDIMVLDYLLLRDQEEGNRSSNSLSDGKLWVILLTILDLLKWNSTNEGIVKTIQAKRIADNQCLLRNAEAENISRLLHLNSYPEASKWIRSDLPALRMQVSKVERHLSLNFQSYLNSQIDNVHQPDDLVYGLMGWGVVISEDRVIIRPGDFKIKIHLYKLGKDCSYKSSGHYVNLRIASGDDEQLSTLLEPFNSNIEDIVKADS